MKITEQELLATIKWDLRQLIPVITQDHVSGEVLMMAWMNKQSLVATLQTGYATYWSRSRQSLWKKGETSGHIQNVKGIFLDCDGDTLLLKVEQVGGVSCHTGAKNCFFKQLATSA